ncbi:hypothetical protein JNB_01685 [Janibacter sp. HTCC2649]|uniref:iron chaperone n=1 Tax=Janibacter sp. HTCC2649 TaxID=313589 RepID=UPI000066ED3C|nr:DUF1801 domain-containing protein [Janibacter sp. HTCC2649]EAP98839.1 hypothetical protein JNB_01685 [Janibacter sp. HTCC2649]
MTTTTATTKTASTTSTTTDGFTADERAAMKTRAKELRAEAKGAKDRAAGEADLLAKIAEMPDADRVLAQRIHSLVSETAPELMPKTWYGMPAYANAEGKVVLHFKAAAKFGSRYATLGFSDSALLDEGTVWPTEFAITRLTDADEKMITALVTKAVA